MHMWPRATVFALCGSALASVLPPPPLLRGMAPAPGVSHAPVRTLLKEAWTPSSTELTALESGSPIVKTLANDVPEDLSFVGAIHVDAPAERFIERFRDIEQFDAGKGVRRIQRFKAPPSIDDLSRLQLGEKDVRALASCTPGDCDVKLSAAAIARFKQEIDWRAPDAPARATQLARELLLARLQAYQRAGDRGLEPYHDHDPPLDTGASFQSMLAHATPLSTYLPDLFAYVRDFPRVSLPGTEDFYYWAEVDFGMKPTLRLSHVTIYRAPANSAGIAYAIVTRQLYASHYFHSTLEVRFLVDDGRADERGFFLVCWLDARSDGMTGLLGPFIRLQARRKSRNGLGDYLQHVQEMLQGLAAANARKD